MGSNKIEQGWSKGLASNFDVHRVFSPAKKSFTFKVFLLKNTLHKNYTRKTSSPPQAAIKNSQPAFAQGLEISNPQFFKQAPVRKGQPYLDFALCSTNHDLIFMVQPAERLMRDKSQKNINRTAGKNDQWLKLPRALRKLISEVQYKLFEDCQTDFPVIRALQLSKNISDIAVEEPDPESIQELRYRFPSDQHLTDF